MFKKQISLLIAGIMVLSLAACGATSNEGDKSGTVAEQEETVSSDNESEDNNNGNIDQASGIVSNTIAVDTDALVSSYADKFEQIEYTDSETGLSVTYNLFLPENYDTSAAYPMVVFIADSSCAGNNPAASLTQGRGALVWATDEWQKVNPTIVAVPTYPETILDDHGSYTTTEYVELTKRLIDYIAGEYAVDKNRIYGTGQSMGCMTTLILASEYPDFYAACMFVDGQWDINTLKGLEGQKFIYFAAENDTNAYNGMQEVMSMFDGDSTDYTYRQWDGNWTPDELSVAAEELFATESLANCISWKTGTIEAKGGDGGMGHVEKPDGSKDFGGPNDSFGGHDGSKKFEGSKESDNLKKSDKMNDAGEKGSMAGGMNNSSYHMASFDYAYNCIAVMEWIFQQAK